ncbi:MAG: hypothetical protein JO249_25095 [Acidobacteria bacterium]|nr:hypothetical protein [Acidobacteriota bacterium]
MDYVIDSDHGAIRIGLTTGEQEQYMELRAEQVDKFQDALEAALATIKVGKVGEGCQQRWWAPCYSRRGELGVCEIKTTDHGALRIACVTSLTGLHDCALELRAEHISEFRSAIEAALSVFKIDVAIYGEHWADDEEEDSGEKELSPIGDEELFAAEVAKMVAEDAPQLFALVGEIGERVDAITIAWGMAFTDHAQVITKSHDGTCGTFRSAEGARKILSADDKIKLHLVWAKDAQEHIA